MPLPPLSSFVDVVVEVLVDVVLVVVVGLLWSWSARAWVRAPAPESG